MQIHERFILDMQAQSGLQLSQDKKGCQGGLKDLKGENVTNFDQILTKFTATSRNSFVGQCVFLYSLIYLDEFLRKIKFPKKILGNLLKVRKILRNLLKFSQEKKRENTAPGFPSFSVIFQFFLVFLVFSWFSYSFFVSKFLFF